MRFRGGLVLEAHRLLYHSTLGLRVTKKKERRREVEYRCDGELEPEEDSRAISTSPPGPDPDGPALGHKGPASGPDMPASGRASDARSACSEVPPDVQHSSSAPGHQS